jgi:hypothetical protein
MFETFQPRPAGARLKGECVVRLRFTNAYLQVPISLTSKFHSCFTFVYWRVPFTIANAMAKRHLGVRMDH